jgi:asparagine synthase (glutamine-hydrolysing)
MFENHPDIVNARLVSSLIDSVPDVWVPIFQEYVDSIPGYVAAQEHPSRLRGLPCYMLFQRIGKQVKVCLNGEGADELFGGYPEYVDPSFRIKYIARKLPVLRRLGVSPSEKAAEVIHGLVGGIKNGSYLERIFAINLKDSLVRHHLEITDKYSMAASLEIRVPYLDHELVEFVAGLPIGFKVDPSTRTQKKILKTVALKASAGRLGHIVRRKKIGFPSVATSYWDRFGRLCDHLLPDDYLSRHELGYCFPSKLELLGFEIFSEIFLNRRGEAARPERLLEWNRFGSKPRLERRSCDPMKNTTLSRVPCPSRASTPMPSTGSSEPIGEG